MEPLLQPLVFTPVYKTSPWGGSRIAGFPGRSSSAPSPCSESWEISSHPGGVSVLRDGVLTLPELAARGGLAGWNAPVRDCFPLLFKIIDAAENLSVQVHPNNGNAARVGGSPKTEMWYVLDAGPGASLYAGLKPGVTRASLEQALRQGDGSVVSLLNELPATPGTAVVIPGGLVHALGAGCLVYEVQQSSDTTYRLYDWDRPQVPGRPRPLQTEKALETIDFSLEPPSLAEPRGVETRGVNEWYRVAGTRYFEMRKLRLRGPETVRLRGDTFHALFVEKSGGVRVTAGGVSVELSRKTSCLVPADAGTYTLEPLGAKCNLLVTWLPDNRLPASASARPEDSGHRATPEQLRERSRARAKAKKGKKRRV